MNSLLYNENDIRIENINGNEIYIFDPYNSLNKEITEADVQGILKKYGIHQKINNFQLYKRAFVHRSYIKRPQIENKLNNITISPPPEGSLPLYTKSNERLEFIGDGLLECITKYYLYCRFPKENEGFMTEKKIALVKNESIGKMALEMGLNKWFILSKHAELKQTRNNLKKLGCLFESFIGAMFLDFNKIALDDLDLEDFEPDFHQMFLLGSGFQIVQVFLKNVFEHHVDWISLIKNDDNYKNILQVKIQKEFKVTPYYLEMTEHDVDTGYHMGVYLCLGQSIHGLKHYHSIHYSQFKSCEDIHQYMAENNKLFLFLGEGKHKIKRKAEQIASEYAIRFFSIDE